MIGETHGDLLFLAFDGSSVIVSDGVVVGLTTIPWKPHDDLVLNGAYFPDLGFGSISISKSGNIKMYAEPNCNGRFPEDYAVVPNMTFTFLKKNFSTSS